MDKTSYLSLNSWNRDYLRRIGSTLGVPKYVDECTTKQLKIFFARIPVEMEVTIKVPNEISVEDPNGKVIKQKILYDCLPPFCAKCQKVGHICEDKKEVQKGKVTQKWVPVQQKATMAPTLASTSKDGIRKEEVVGAP